MRRRTAARGSGSLLGTAARTAVIASTATKVSARTAEKEAVRRAGNAAPAPAPVAAPPATSTDDMLAQLTQLGGLRDAGVLTEDEFAAAKAKILG